MEEELKERAQLLDATTDSIVFHDLDGNIIFANVTACRAHGYSIGEFMKMNILDLNVPESVIKIERGTMELMEKGETTYESVHIRKDKSAMPVEVHAQMIEVSGSPLVMSVARDIMARKPKNLISSLFNMNIKLFRILCLYEHLSCQLHIN